MPTDNDTKLLSEAYSQMLGEKALTPEQIKSKGKAAGSKGGGLPKNSTNDKTTEKTLSEVPYTDQHADNFTQDGKDKKVKDPYVLKEGIDINQVSDDQLGQAIRAYFAKLPDAERQKLLSGITGAGNTTPPAPTIPAPEGVPSAM